MQDKQKILSLTIFQKYQNLLKLLLFAVVLWLIYLIIRQKGENIEDVLQQFQQIFSLKNFVILAIVILLTPVNWAFEAWKWYVKTCMRLAAPVTVGIGVLCDSDSRWIHSNRGRRACMARGGLGGCGHVCGVLDSCLGNGAFTKRAFFVVMNNHPRDASDRCGPLVGPVTHIRRRRHCYRWTPP